MEPFFKVGVEFFVIDRVRNTVLQLASQLGRADEAVERLNARMRELDRVGATRSQLFNLQNFDRRARMQSQMAQQEARVRQASGIEQAAALERLSELQQRGDRQAEMALIRRNDLLAREQAQRETLLAQQAEANRMAELERTRGLAMKGLVAGGLAAAGGSALLHLARAGGEFEVAQLRAGVPFGFTPPAGMAEVMDVAHQTMFSIKQVTDIETAMAQMGLAFGTIKSQLPTFAKGAEVLYRLRGVDLEEATQSMAGAYQIMGLKPEQAAPFVRRFVGLELRTPADPSQFLRQLSYIGPMARAAGMDPMQTLNVAALVSELQGAATRGGLGPQAMSRFFETLAGGGSKGATATLEAMDVLNKQGVLRPDLRGNFGGILAQLSHERDVLGTLAGQRAFGLRLAKAGGAEGSKPVMEAGMVFAQEKQAMPADEFLAKVDHYLGEVVAHAAMTLSLPTVGEKYGELTSYQPPSIQESQARFLDTLPGRVAQFATDANSLATVLGQRLDPKMTSFIKSIDNATNSLTQYLAKHPGAADAAVGGVGVGTAAASAASATMLIKAGMRAFGWTGAAETFGKAAGGAFVAAALFGMETELIKSAGPGFTIGGILRHFIDPSHPPITPVPPYSGTPSAPLPSLTPSAPPYAKPEPGAEAMSAHGGGGGVHIETLHVHYEKSTPADAEKLIHDLRRMSRSTGSSTGASGPESTAVHGYFPR